MICARPKCGIEFPDVARVKLFCSERCRNSFNARLLTEKRKAARAAGETAPRGRHPEAPGVDVSDIAVRPWKPLAPPRGLHADNIDKARAYHALPSYYGRK